MSENDPAQDAYDAAMDRIHVLEAENDELRACCERLETLAKLIDDALKKLGPDGGRAFLAKHKRMEELLKMALQFPHLTAPDTDWREAAQAALQDTEE